VFIQLLANGLVTGSVIALAAAGVSIVYGILRLVNFAYGDYMTFGAFRTLT
jgi:neutral amino acid transport system permease protein